MRTNQNQYVISIMSRDRVGIVHEVSQSICDLDGNIADIRQSVLCGYFTMILLASFPSSVSHRDIERKLAEVDARSETAIDVAVKKVDVDGRPSGKTIPDNAYVLTATGPDRVGFVATVSSFCANNNINILDLSTTSANGEYVMILITDLSKCPSMEAIRRDLQDFAREKGLRIVLQHYDIFRAVNEINLPIH
ncbi:glycine cleavage system protein R [Leptolinea tardivitalis]|uniref:glycine cleavage system protein R n=1 Tax=Leptolinea tardivitalis TaxID=229920 RepID=UPI00078079DB|nr:ACT domain-containing protein [Leptolinea tardivitalis]GAP19990.1 aCT domain-containing protein [Leptolinea tardivitalis]